MPGGIIDQRRAATRPLALDHVLTATLTGAVTDAPGRPLNLAERAPGPDLARGSMLLLIALANSHYFLQGASVLGGYPQDGSTLDRVVIWVLATFVDGRAFPLFGFLFGYGVAQIVRRQTGLGPSGVRRLLWRRALVLIVVGFLHAVLLYAGDILAAYGVLLLILAWMVNWQDRWLWALAVAVLTLTALPSGDSLSISRDPPDASLLPPDLAALFSERPQVSLVIALLGPVGFLCPALIGVWAGRRRILEHPERHRTLLVATAAVGLTVAALGAQPVALVLAGVVPVPEQGTLEVIGPLHDAAGVLGGLGYAALVTLAAAPLLARWPSPVTAVIAVGQRSMTCYLAQSLVWALVFTPFLLGLSDTLSVAGTAVLAIATWLTTVAMADWMRRTGRRGPFEVMTRRVTYGRPPPQPSVRP